MTGGSDQYVPFALRVAGSWAWRMGLVLIAAGMLVWLLSHLTLLIIPLMVAALLAALLRPVTGWMIRRRVPRGLAVAITEVGLIVVVLGALFLVGRQVVAGMSDLGQQAIKGLLKIQDWLTNGPLGLSTDQITKYLNDVLDNLQHNSGAILSKVLTFGTGFGEFGAGLLLTLFILIFFLLEGERIWQFAVRLFPRLARPAVDGAGRRGWTSLGQYVRVQILVAGVDAVGIGVGAAIIQVPLALPLAVLVFLGSFIPVVGALVTGAVAVLLALVANGWVNALIMLAIVLAVQQLESHLLQPFIMGRAVKLHPVAVVLAVAAGSAVAGILGALFAVPVLAVANSSVRYIATRGWDDDPTLAGLHGRDPADAPDAGEPPSSITPAPAEDRAPTPTGAKQKENEQ